MSETRSSLEKKIATFGTLLEDKVFGSQDVQLPSAKMCNQILLHKL